MSFIDDLARSWGSSRSAGNWRSPPLLIAAMWHAASIRKNAPRGRVATICD